MADWISAGIEQGCEGVLEQIFRLNSREEEVLVAEDYEVEQPCCLEDSEAPWDERVLGLRSPVHAERQVQGLGSASRPGGAKAGGSHARQRGGANVRSPRKQRSWRPLITG